MKSIKCILSFLAVFAWVWAQGSELDTVRIPSHQIQKGADETAHLTRKGNYPVVAMPSKTKLEFDTRLGLAAISLKAAPGSPYAGWELLRIVLDAPACLAGNAVLDLTYGQARLEDSPALSAAITLDVMDHTRLSSTAHNYYLTVFPAALTQGRIGLSYYLRSPDGRKTLVLSHAIPVRECLFKAGRPTRILETIPAQLTREWTLREHKADVNAYRSRVLDLIKRCGIASCQVTFVDHIDSIAFVAVNEDFYNEKPVRKSYVNRPIDMQSIYQAASMSKVPCAYIFAKMADEGEVDLDTPLYKYYPGLLGRFNPKYREQAKLITGRMALTHTAGCGSGYGNIPLDFYPGYQYNYRNSNIVIVQYVIEYLKGKRIDEVAQDYIYGKRDLPNSRYCWQPQYDSLAVTAFTDTVPYNHQKDWYVNDYIKYSDFPWDKGRTGIDNNTSYHWRTNSTECTRFWSWLLEGADLSEEMFNEFIDQGVQINADETSLEKGNRFSGLGTRTEYSDELGAVTYHTGRNGPFRSLGITFLERNAALSFFTNTRHYYAMYHPLLDIFIPHSDVMSWTMWVADAGTPVPGWKTSEPRKRPVGETLSPTAVRDTQLIRAQLESIMKRAGISALHLAYRDSLGDIVFHLGDENAQACSDRALPLYYQVLKLVEENRLELDTPLARYMPGFADLFESGSRDAARKVTARMCLQHTSGIYASGGQFKIRHAPGATYYANSGDERILRLAVSQISGTPAEEAIPEQTKAEDFSSFLQWTLAGGNLSPALNDAIRSRLIHVGAAEYRRERMSLWRGLGWNIERNAELGEILYHTGEQSGWKNLAMVLPESGATLCAFARTDSRINFYDALVAAILPTQEPLSCFGCGSLYPLEDEESYYKSAVLDLIRRAGIPSMQVCYTRPGLTLSFAVTNEDFYAMPEHAPYRLREIDTETTYEACSISKVPLAYLACRMADQGRLDLDKPLYEYAPEILDRFVPEDRRQAKKLTARICLTHAAGLDNSTYGRGEDDRIRFKFPLGEYHYSGPGVMLVQRTLEHIWGEGLDTYAARELFRPLGMMHTDYRWQPYNEELSPYGFRTGRVQRDKDWNGDRCNAAYSMRTTAEEFTRFLYYIMDGGELSPGMYRQMLSRYTERPAGDAHNVHHGLGWLIIDDPQLGEIIYHTGNNVSFKGNALANPGKRETLVYFLNGDHPYNINGPMTQLFFGGQEPMAIFQSGQPIPAAEN